MDDIFMKENYNIMVRPVNLPTGETLVNTDLKLLQIDLVIQFKKLIKLKNNKTLKKDEKYQELIAVVWLEMVSKKYCEISF